MSDRQTFFYSFYGSLLLILAAAAIFYGLLFGRTLREPDTEAAAKPAPGDTVLLTCVREDSRTLPQSFALVCISPNRGQISLTNLPGDLTVRFGARRDTLPQCYAYAGMMQVQESLLAEGIETDFCIGTDFEGLKAMTDLLGPFAAEIPRGIYHRDGRGRMLFRQPPGKMPIGGEALCGILKYTDFTGGDRTALWLSLYKEALSAYVSDENAGRFAEIFKELYPHLQTDLTAKDAEKLQQSLVFLAENGIQLCAPRCFSADDLGAILSDYF